MVIEDAEAPHHMRLLRNFMTQGLVHNQPHLYASPARDPRGFLGTLPSPAASKDDKSREHDPNQEKGLRIAWQYKKYFGENQFNFDGQRGARLFNRGKEQCEMFGKFLEAVSSYCGLCICTKGVLVFM